MFLFKRNRELIEKINQYLVIGSNDIKLFEDAMHHYITNGNDRTFEGLLEKISDIEGEADTLLHDIEGFLYKKSLLPESRGDLKRLLERYDDIIDCTHDVLIYLNTRDVSLPVFITEDIKEMVTISTRCSEQVKLAIQDLLGKREKVKDFVHTINEFESHCDAIQAKCIKNIFSSDIDNFDKMLLADLLGIITKLTDYCEDAADHIMVINIKRVV